jgi:hypothetical protein
LVVQVEKRVERCKCQRSAPFARENPWADWKRTCKSLEQEENHEKGPRLSWVRNETGNINQKWMRHRGQIGCRRGRPIPVGFEACREGWGYVASGRNEKTFLKTTKSLFGVLTIMAGLMMVLQPCFGQAWVGIDDFSSGISTNWTVYQQIHGQMFAVGTNQHLSFIVGVSATTEQTAQVIWNGTPAVSNDWTMDIAGHNSASWSANGSSQLQLIVADTASLSTPNIIYWGISMRRGDVNANHPFTASFNAGQTVQATTANFGLRVVHRGELRVILKRGMTPPETALLGRS